MGIEQQICDAIQIIVDKSISSAGFDRTIKATISECLDAAAGKYKLEYQDTTIIAYSDVQYPIGTLVNVIIPNNDMSSVKKIQSAASINMIPYSSIVETEDLYEILGTSLVANTKNNVSLNGYKNENKLLYEYGKTGNVLSLLEDREIQQYMRQADTFSIGMRINTTLPLELQKDGDYGIIAILSYIKEDDISQQVKLTYVFDNSYLNGNPYLLIDANKQAAYFDIEGAKFDHIEKIIAYTRHFPVQNPSSTENNIFFNDIEIFALRYAQEEMMNGGIVKLTTPKGVIFSETDSEQIYKSIEAHMFLDMKETKTNLKFLWFKENGAVTTQDIEKYCSFGGAGWECLNAKNRYTLEGSFIDDGEALPDTYIVEWIPSEVNILNIYKSSVTTRTQKYKCVVICDEQIYKKEVEIVNYGSPYDVTLVSNDGIKFYNGCGKPILTCSVYYNGIEKTDLTNFEFIWSDEDMNENSFIPDEANATEHYTIINKNKISVNVSSISKYHTYKVSVLENVNGTKVPRGDAQIKIFNVESNENTYSLYLKNAQQIFKYNSDNIAPTSQSLANPIELKPLTFSFFDPEGREIKAEEIIRMGGKITWKVPTNTMLHILNVSMATPQEIANMDLEYDYYFNAVELPYDISPTYQEQNYRNNIILEVVYKGFILTTTTEFTFIKDGDSGTNGTDYICRILPNKKTNEYPTLTVDSTGAIIAGNFKNGTVTNSDSREGDDVSWFKAELWKGTELVKTWYMNKAYDDISWYMMNYKDNVIKGFSNYEVLNTSDSRHYIRYSNNSNLVTNILKAEITYDNKLYTVEYPILTAIVSNGYRIGLKPETGYTQALYQEDGTYPKYNNSFPFEIEVTYNGQFQNINLSEYDVTWSILNGGEFYKDGSYSTSSQNLIIQDEVDNEILTAYRNEMAAAIALAADQRDIKIKEIENKYRFNILPNRRNIIPTPIFESSSTSNAIKVEVKRNDSIVATLHIPIYLYLNRFGKSAINGWDGNSITNGDDYILTPQIGAGKKESNNTFTGMIMGKVQHSQGNEEVGLFGYNKGIRNIFLNCDDGSAHFGHGECSIDIEPGSKGAATAIFKGGGYRETTETEEGRGFILDLTTPYMKYGNGNFKVTKDGILYAKGAHFTDGTISLGTETERVFEVTSDGIMTMTKGSITLGDGVFSVDDQGILTMTKGSITLGDGVFSVTDEGQMTMKKGSISLGGTAETPNFKVTDQGVLTVKKGSISLGVNSNSTTGYNFDVQNDGTLTLTKGSISLGYNSTTKRYNFTVNNNGELTIKRGSISLGEITDDEGNVADYKFKVTNNGQMTMTNGSISLGKQTDGSYNFSVNNNGQLTMTKGSISLGKNSDGTYSFKVANNGTGNFGVWKFTNSKMSADLTSGGTFDLDANGIKITDGTNEIFKATRTGGVLGYWNFSTTGIENPEQDISLGSSGLKIGSYVSISKNGSFTMGDETGKKFIKFDATNKSFTLGSGITLTWGQVDGHPTDLSEFTNNDDKYWVTSVGKDWIQTGEVVCQNLSITGGSITLGGDKFVVDNTGKCIARAFTAYGTNDDIFLTLSDRVRCKDSGGSFVSFNSTNISIDWTGHNAVYINGLDNELRIGSGPDIDTGATLAVTQIKATNLKSKSDDHNLIKEEANKDEITYRTKVSQKGHPTWISGGVYKGDGGDLNISDFRLKDNIMKINSLYEDFFKELNPCSFTFLDGDSNRTHIGFIAQDVLKAAEKVSLTSQDIAAYVKTFYPEDTALPVRYSNDGDTNYLYMLNYQEFIALNTHMIQKCLAKIEELEERIKILEGTN